ncbi:hypothetical protein RRG08_020260 [Elysia crispata]|uniref:ShKT domain-containing protein n=1 Tax=Elysia crispata TaxID=231223 RepID=A0AAE1B4G8_9GAST|nr:hypothetical protein RRG08_020260 [Elysia crispata]
MTWSNRYMCPYYIQYRRSVRLLPRVTISSTTCGQRSISPELKDLMNRNKSPGFSNSRLSTLGKSPVVLCASTYHIVTEGSSDTLAFSEKDLECTDRYGDPKMCKFWQEQGECDVTDWMLENCQRACGLCAIDESEDDRFLGIMEDIYKYRYREFPEHGSFVGFHDYDDKLESFTMAAFQRRKAKSEQFIDKLRQLDTGQMSKKNRRELRILTSYLQTFVEGYRWRKYGPLNSLNFLQGLSRGPQWPYWHRLETEVDFERYLKRLAAVPNQINEQITLMKRAIKLNRSSHRVSVDRVPDMLRSWNVKEQFLHPFQAKLHRKQFSKIRRGKLWDKAMVLMPHISAAVSRLKRFMDEDYLKETRPKPGVHSLPQGLEYYEACLKWYLGYPAKAGEVFELGVQEVRRIEKEIKKVMKSVGYNGTLRKFFKHIETIPKFYNHTKVEFYFASSLFYY